MRIRSAVSALGATLALAVMLTTTTTPAFAARPTEKHTKPLSPTTVEMEIGNKQTVEPTSSRSTSSTTGSKQNIEQMWSGPDQDAFMTSPPYQQGSPSFTGNGTNNRNGNNNAGPTYPQGSASAVSTGVGNRNGNSNNSSGNGGPTYPQGSQVPNTGSGSPALPSGSIIPNSAVTGPVYQQGSGPAFGAGSNGPPYQHGPAPLFQGPASTVGTGNSAPTYPQGQSSTTSTVDPGPEAQARPDVRVSYVNSAWNSSSTLYHFRVENVGGQLATGINLSSVVREQSGTTNAGRRVEEQFTPITSLAPGQAQDVVVTCTPHAGFQCVSGALDAFVANDLNPANNGAHS